MAKARLKNSGRGVGADGNLLKLVKGTPGDLTAPSKSKIGEEIVVRRHAQWLENFVFWKRIMDAYEGGDRYRNAVYGPDRKGLPIRNLIRHRRETPDPGQYPAIYQGFAGFMGMASAKTQDTGYGPFPGMIGADPGATAQDDDYEMRRARTPVPEFLAEAVDIHLGKIYDQEVSRHGPPELEEWWRDIDDRGTPIDEWMENILAPQLLVMGCIDLCLDHPHAPNGVQIKTQEDIKTYGLDRVCVSIILPQNMVWWKLDTAMRYEECLVREYVDPSNRKDRDDKDNAIDPEDPGSIGEQWRRDYLQYRHWTAEKSTLYNFDGSEIIEEIEHPYGCVPIVRLVDKPKHRDQHIGKSRYEAICEYQREYYNRDSELIMSDTLQSSPLLMGPEEVCKSDQTMSLGPNYLLPIIMDDRGNRVEWKYISPDKDPAESIRQNKNDIMNLSDRHACLTSTSTAATAKGNASGTYQSGISKQLDAINGNKLLGDIAKSLAKAERFIAEYFLLCYHNQVPDKKLRSQVSVLYPARFELFGAMELSNMLMQFQANLQGLALTGCPLAQAIWLKEQIRQALVGLTDDQYRFIDAEIDGYVQMVMKARMASGESGVAAITSAAEALQGKGTEEQRAQMDPTGQSGATLVSGLTPAVLG